MYPRNIFTCVKIHIKRNKDEHIVMKQWIIDEDEFNFSQIRKEKTRALDVLAIPRVLTCECTIENRTEGRADEIVTELSTRTKKASDEIRLGDVRGVAIPRKKA